MKTIITVWVIAILMAPLTRLIGRLYAEEDGDYLWIAYLIYALIVCILFSGVVVYVCGVLGE